MRKFSNNRGITLIALVVTIIVLLILAGIAIAMLRGDNGILNRAAEAKFANIIGSFDEQTRLAAMSVRTNIESNKVSKDGYIATAKETVGSNQVAKNLKELADEVASGLDVTANEGKAGNSINTEGYTVVYYLETEGNTSQDGDGYIAIWYTDNSLRSSMDKVQLSNYGFNNDNTTGENISVNEAVIACTIHVQNYGSEMSGKILTSISTGNEDVKIVKNYSTTSLSPITATLFTSTQKENNNSGNNNNTQQTRQRDNIIRMENVTGANFLAGEEVIFVNERFFVLSDDGTNVKLLAKFCLNREGTEQVDAGNEVYGRAFSKTNYIGNETNLQTSEMITAAELDGDISTGIPNAIIAARNYGISKGVTGRLMTYDEVDAIQRGNIEGNAAQKAKMKNIINGKISTPKELYWWLGNAQESLTFGNRHIYFTDGYAGNIRSDIYSSTNKGVRPVLEVQ